MPKAGAVTGTGERLYVCEDCHGEERLPYAGLGLEKPCSRCGGLCFCDPFPAVEALRRLDRLARRLEAEDGALGVEG